MCVCPRKPEEDFRYSGVRITVSCEPSKVNAGNQTQVLCKRGVHSSPLSPLPSPWCVSVYTCMCVCTTCVLVLVDTREGVGSPGTGVRTVVTAMCSREAGSCAGIAAKAIGQRQ